MFKETAKELAEKIRSLVWSDLTGRELNEHIEGLGLTNPVKGFCKLVGTDKVGRILCENCPISGGKPAGCMRYIQPAIRNALTKRVGSSKLCLEKFAQILDLVEDGNQDTILQDK